MAVSTLRVPIMSPSWSSSSAVRTSRAYPRGMRSANTSTPAGLADRRFCAKLNWETNRDMTSAPPVLSLFRNTIPGRGGVDLYESYRTPVYIPGISVQLHMGFGAPGDDARQRIEKHLDEAVQGVLVHLVQRQIHELREITLDHDGTARDAAH